MPWGVVAGAVIGAAGSAIAGHEQASASRHATDAQVEASRLQIDESKREFNAVMANNAPYMKAGSTALSELSKGFAPGGQFTKGFTSSDFTKSPEYKGYQFEQSQAADAAKRYAASTGRALSPSTAAAIAGQTQGIAATDYSNWFSQAYNQWLNQQNQVIGGLSGLTNLGEAAVNNQVVAGGNALKATTSALGSQGNALAQNAINQGNIGASTIGNITGGISSALSSPQVQNLFSGSSQGPSWAEVSSNFNASDFPTVQPLTSSELGLTL